MDFKQLEVFIAVVKHQSFSKAARELFLTQPTVSSHIQNLERELDTILINRSSKIITLTKSGEIMYKHSIDILNNCKKALYDMKEYSGKIEGDIDIASSSIPETYILPGFLKEFTKNYPDVRFSISHYDSQYAISEILNERVNFGFVGTKIKNSQIKYIDLVSDELVLITPKNLKFRNKKDRISKEELMNLNFIIRKEGSGTRMLMLKTLQDNNINIDRLNIIAHVESNESIKEMVRVGIGVSLISYISAKDYIDSEKIKMYRVENMEFIRQFYFIYSKKKIFTPVEEMFLDKLCKYYNTPK